MFAGALNEIVADPLPVVADTLSGGPGSAAGVTGAAVTGGPEPTSLLADTLHVYAVPLVNPVIVIGLPGPEPVTDPGLQMAA